jgi:hypothetical protein
MQFIWEWWLLSLPIFLLLSNLILGIYSYFKTATGKKKSIYLSISLVVVCLGGMFASDTPPLVFLWGMILAGPLVLPRILLGLPYGRHRQLIKTVTKQKGPILIVGGAGYIGTHVIDLLLQEGKYVRVLDSLMYGKEPLSDFINNRFFELMRRILQS